MCRVHIYFPGQSADPSRICLSMLRALDNADHNAAVGIAMSGIKELLFGDALTKPHKTTRIFPRKHREVCQKLGPERSEVTPGETDIRHAKLTAPTHQSRNQEPLGVIPETPT